MATICAAAPLALANQLPLPTIVQRGWSQSRSIATVSSAIEQSDLYLSLSRLYIAVAVVINPW